ncbi:MAG: H/ACA ribonucleoprotein complex subunit GAR1 [Candidatus Sigynarchaeota archaeon]
MSTSSAINHSPGKPLRLGKPLQRTSADHLLFRVGADIPLKSLGERVVDSSMTNCVGTVYDIFGPVESPFLSVKLQDSGEARSTNDVDYLSASYFVLLEQRRPGGRNAKDARKFSKSTRFTKTAKTKRG